MRDQPDYPPIRRIVTGSDASGAAKALIDAATGNWKSSAPGTVSTLMWSTDATPADITVGAAIEDRGAGVLGTAAPAHGTHARRSTSHPATASACSTTRRSPTRSMWISTAPPSS